MRKQKLIALITTILVGFGVTNAFSQDNDVPLVIKKNRYNEILAELPVDYLDEPLKGYIMLTVEFENDLSDTTKIVKPDTAYVRKVAFVVNGKRVEISRLRIADISTPLEKSIWEACLGKPVEWMMKQPYDEYFDRIEEFYLETYDLTISYPILFVPNKKE